MMRNTLLLDAMDLLVKVHQDAQMVLVLSGNEKDIELFKESIKDRPSANNIIIKTKVPFDELNALYSSSSGLIIPLDPGSIADIARFSKKVAEYVATGRPIITNAVGEIPYYFDDRKSAYIVDYTAEGFSNAMLEMIEDKKKAAAVGRLGFQVGLENFDYRINALKLIEFTKDL